jgi:hypothetical protein
MNRFLVADQQLLSRGRVVHVLMFDPVHAIVLHDSRVEMEYHHDPFVTTSSGVTAILGKMLSRAGRTISGDEWLARLADRLQTLLIASDTLRW